ncbi:MAG TPA: autotransporter-associated beta strand repeat-containing protein, partial [Lacipirellulaceae bacterium]
MRRCRPVGSLCESDVFRTSTQRVFALVVAVLGVIGILAAPCTAGEIWTGGGGSDNWSNGNNWFNLFVAVPPPNNGTADIQFPGATRLTPNLDANWDIESLNFVSTTGSYVLGTSNGSTLTIRGGGLNYTSPLTQTINTPLNLAAAQTWNVAGPNLVVNGQVGGTASVVKTGAGNVVFNHTANTFTGGLTIQGGRVDGKTLSDFGAPSSFGTGHLALSGGAELRWTGGINVSSRATSNRNVTLGAGGGVLGTQTGSLTISGLVSGSGGLTVGANGEIELTNAGNSFAGDIVARDGIVRGSSIADAGINSSFGRGHFFLTREGGITYSGPTASTDRNITLLDEGENQTSRPAISTANPSATLTWNGLISGPGKLVAGGAGTLVLANPNNSFTDTLWISGTVAGDTIANRFVNSSFGAGFNFFLFGTLSYTGPTASTDRNVTLGTNGRIEVANSATTLTMTGQFLGDQQSDQLTKTGPGRLLLPPIGFNGRVNVAGGTLSSSSVAGFGNASPSTTLSGGGILEYTGPTATFSRTVILGTGGGAIDVTNAASTLTWNAFSLSGAGPFTKLGDGTLIMNVTNNTSTGGIVVAGGTLQGSVSSLRGNIANDAALVIDQAVDATFSGNISGGGSLTKTGAATLTLAGTNSYSGGTTVSAGTLQVSTNSLVGNIVNNAIVVFDQSMDGAFDGQISGSGAITKTGAGNLVLARSDNSFAGSLSILAGRVTGSTLTDLDTDSSFGQGNLLLDGGSILSYTGASTATNRQVSLGAGGGQFEITDGAATLSLVGLVEGAGGVTKTGPGTLQLLAENTYADNTRINEGTLAIFADANLGAAPAAAGINLQCDGGALRAYGGEFAIHPNRWLQLGAAGGTIDVLDGSELTVRGRINGTGGLTKTGPGTLVLSGINGYDGGTFVDQGTLDISWDSDLGAWPATPEVNLTLDGATLATHAFVALHPNRRVRVEAGGGTIDVAAGGTLHVLGDIEGPGMLTKTGAGTLFLHAENSSLAETIVEEGTLAGDGTLAGAVVVQNGATIAPGATAGRLQLGSVELASGATLEIELGGTELGTQYDSLQVADTAM